MFSARFCAVTMISSSCCAIRGWHASAIATAIGVRGMRRGTGVDLAPLRRALLDLEPFIAILPPDSVVLSLQGGLIGIEPTTRFVKKPAKTVALLRDNNIAAAPCYDASVGSGRPGTAGY